MFAKTYFMTVPEQVKNAARNLINQYGDSFEHLGSYEGADYFVYKFPDDFTTGFPFVYQFNHGSVLEIAGPKALSIIELFVEDIEVVDIE